jgi:hypothetical protein
MSNIHGIKFIDTSENVVGFKVADGKPRISCTPYTYDIAEGNVTNHVTWNKIGFNGALPANVSVDLAPYTSASYTFPASAMSMSIVSTSAFDGGTSAGIQSVRIYYLDAAYAEATVNVTLAGTTSVNVGVGNIFRINNVRATAVGSTSSAAGNISIKNQAGSQTYGWISAGHTRQRQLVYTVPAGKTLYVTSYRFSCVSGAKQAQVLFTNRATFDDKAGTVLPANFFMPFNEVILQDSSINVDLSPPTKLPATTDLKVSVKGDQAGAMATASLRGWTE